MAAGFPTKANWAAGDVLTAAQMDDLAATVNLYSPAGVTSGYVPTANGTSNSITWTAPASGAPYVAGKNAIINGAMDVWQRGTSFTSAWGGNGTYTADRFSIYHNVTGGTVTRQNVSDTTNLPTIQYCARIARNNADTSTANFVWAYTLESADSYRFAGQAVTISFYARKGANYSATSSALGVSLASGTGTDQNVNLPFTGAATVASGTATLTTTWQRFQYTGTVAATATELGMTFTFTPTGTAGAADYFEITGIQLELGSTASTFSRSYPTIQGELAACQRYYYRWVTNGTSTAWAATGMVYNTTTALCYVKLPQTMRTQPGALETTATASDYRVLNPGGGTTCSSVPVMDTTHYETPLIKFTTASGLTAGYACSGGANSTNNAYLGFSAEL